MKTPIQPSIQPENYTLNEQSTELRISGYEFNIIAQEFNEFVSGKPQLTTVNINNMIEIEEGLESSNITKIRLFGSEFNEFKLPKLPPKFENLKELEIHTCGMSEIFPISGFSKLEKLTIIECGGLKEIPSLSDLKDLKEIDISACYSIKNIPDTSECSKLEKLTLSGNNTLKTIPSLLNNANLKFVDLSGCDEINFTEELRVELQTLQQRGCKVIYPEKEHQRIQAHSNPSSNSQQNPASQTDEQIRIAGADIHSSASGDQEAGSRDINASAPDDTRARRGFRNTLAEFIRSALGVNPANLGTSVTRNEARRNPDASGVATQPSLTPNNRAQDRDGNNRNPHQSGNNQGNITR